MRPESSLGLCGHRPRPRWPAHATRPYSSVPLNAHGPWVDTLHQTRSGRTSAVAQVDRSSSRPQLASSERGQCGDHSAQRSQPAGSCESPVPSASRKAPWLSRHPSSAASGVADHTRVSSTRTSQSSVLSCSEHVDTAPSPTSTSPTRAAANCSNADQARTWSPGLAPLDHHVVASTAEVPRSLPPSGGARPHRCTGLPVTRPRPAARRELTGSPTQARRNNAVGAATVK